MLILWTKMCLYLLSSTWLKNMAPFINLVFQVSISPLFIYWLRWLFQGPRTSIFVSNVELANQLCDEKRFVKWINAALNQVRNLTGDGLFTAHDGERAWGIARGWLLCLTLSWKLILADRILMPAFGPAKIRGMFPGMMDIASQLLTKWEVSD